LDNKKDISLNVLFRTFQVNFQDFSVASVVSNQMKEHKIGICWFSTKHTALRS